MVTNCQLVQLVQSGKTLYAPPTIEIKVLENSEMSIVAAWVTIIASFFVLEEN